MLLVCPSCHATFRVPEGAIPAEGRTVRCAKCKHEWHAQHPEKEVEPTKPRLTEVEEMLYAQQEAAAEAEKNASAGWATMPQANAEDDITSDPRFAASAMVAAADAAEREQQHDEDFHFDAPAEHNSEEETPTDTEYKVSEEELAAFAGLVSQAELDAIPPASALEALTGEKLEEMPDFDAAFAELEHADDTVAIPKLRPVRKGAESDAKNKEKIILFPKLTKWLSYITAIMLLLGILITLVSYNQHVRHNAPALERLYQLAGYPSSKGVELVDMKIVKKKLPGKVTYDISGAIVNKLAHSMPVPSVRIRLIDEHYNQLRRWDFSQEKTMKPNESLPFSAAKLRALGDTEKDAYAFVVDIGNGLEMMLRD